MYLREKCFSVHARGVVVVLVGSMQAVVHGHYELLRDASVESCVRPRHVGLGHGLRLALRRPLSVLARLTVLTALSPEPLVGGKGRHLRTVSGYGHGVGTLAKRRYCALIWY